MAKALYGFHGGLDPRTEAELATLRAKVRELEAEVAALRAREQVRLADEDLDLALLTTQDAALV
ncbi:MAG TPA: hypothetical protein VF143_06025 [Candidatus Nanopelagicales bacterium]|jgi:hypothetical protein